MKTSSFFVPDEPGTAMSKAHERYCRPDLLEQYRAAGEKAGWRTSGIVYRMGGLTPDESRRAAARAEYQTARKRVVRDLVTKLRDGRLYGMGFVVGSSGRDLDAGRRMIPTDVLSSRHCQLDWRKETISGNGLTFAGVRLCSTYEAPESAASLIGHSLAECFQIVVVDNWMWRELAEPVYKRFATSDLRGDIYDFLSHDHSPVDFDNQSRLGVVALPPNHPIVIGGWYLKEPPEEARTVRRHIESRINRLVDWLRDETLCADGIADPLDRARTRQLIQPDWWREPGVRFCHSDSSLWKMTPPTAVHLFSDIRIVGARSETSTSQAPEGRRRIDDRPDASAPMKTIVSRFIECQGTTRDDQFHALTRDDIPLTRLAQKVRDEVGLPPPHGLERDSGLYKELRKQIRELKAATGR